MVWIFPFPTVRMSSLNTELGRDGRNVKDPAHHGIFSPFPPWTPTPCPHRQPPAWPPQMALARRPTPLNCKGQCSLWCHLGGWGGSCCSRFCVCAWHHSLPGRQYHHPHSHSWKKSLTLPGQQGARHKRGSCSHAVTCWDQPPMRWNPGTQATLGEPTIDYRQN